MADWEDNKGLGPWDFIEQPNKWGYLNNPRWTSVPGTQEFCESKGVISGSPNQHKPCGHWHKNVKTFYRECSLEPFFDWPESVSSESFINYNSAKIFVLQRVYNDGKVYVYNTSGGLITDFSTMGTSPACMRCLTVDNDYCFVGSGANVFGPITNSHIARFDHDGGGGTHWVIPSKPSGIYSDGNHVYVTSTYGLRKYTRSGSLVWEFPYYGVGVGEFRTVYGLWSDKTHLFVADYSVSKIIKYLCSNGNFVLESAIMVPASPTDIIVDDKYVYVGKSWGVCIFHKDNLENICCPIFDDYIYNPSGSLGGITFDGDYWWALSNHTTVVKFDVHVVGELIERGETLGDATGEPQIWPMT